MAEEPLAPARGDPDEELARLQEEQRQVYAAWQQRVRTPPRPLPEARPMVALGTILFLLGLVCLFRPELIFVPLSLALFGGAIAVAAVLTRRERAHRRAYKESGQGLLQRLHEVEAKIKEAQTAREA